jgi:hypothetical protein
MVQRLNVRDKETPERARQRFDGQLGVRAWTVPGMEQHKPEQRDPKAPWWWDTAEEATQTWVAMARARGMVG